MARPKKDPSLVKGEMLKVPVTEDQKRDIVAAATAAGMDMAAWAREVLVAAASKVGVQSQSKKRR